VPFIAGGKTTLANGHALCCPCNLKKGASMSRELLDWQKDCAEAFSGEFLNEKNFVVYAGTGAGKTVAGSKCIYDHLLRESKDIVIVVVPYRDIKTGWANALKERGLEVAVKPSEIAEDTSVIVTTYGGAPGVLNYVVKEYLDSDDRRKIFFVFDEFHHLEETNIWASVFVSFEDTRVSRRLLLSGTPWREKGQLPNAWVQYDEDDEVIPHVRHTYGMNVNAEDKQRNTVEVKFQPTRVYGVERIGLEEVPYDSDRTVRSDSLAPFVSFSDLEEFRERDGLRELLHKAIEKLDALRLTNPLVGGIIFVANKQAGEAVRDYMREIGEDPLLIISDDPLAHKQLGEFRESPIRKWIIAIDMVSEGVDIPRLRVVADFSNRKTLLHIMQRWGRVLRRLRDKNYKPVANDCEAYIFFAGHKQLTYVAEKIEEDVKKEHREGGGGEEPPPPPRPRQILTTNGEDRPSIFKGKQIEDQIEQVADWILATNFNDIRSDNLGLKGAINLAAYLVKTGVVPPEFFQDREDFRVPSFPEQQERTKDDIVRDYKKITDHIIMRGFEGDAAAALKMINQINGVSAWSRKHKTAEQLKGREHACMLAYQNLFGVAWEDR
jgi:superfamily II DNA or RNA helicase